MIVTEARSSTVETNLGTVATRFKIKASARAFKILSGFYSDPVAAIPRELGANAWDSHVKDKNTETPFEVHVPNTLEPWFSVRDFGTGLAPKDIDTIYTTYFESTKTGDNDTDGCMGLGSKTPFNYTDNFTVTSWFGGLKSTYNCFIDEGGGPSIIQLASEPSHERNGMLVKFAVKQADITTFVNKIRQAYLPFRNRPKLIGIHTINFPEIKYEHSGDGWAMQHVGTESHGSRALMGNYSYPIASSVYGWSSCKGITDDELRIARNLLSNGYFDLQFSIGDLDVTPNKEQLQYDVDDRTRAAIIKRAVAASAELSKRVMDTLKPATLWEAMTLHWMYNSYNNPADQTIRRIMGTINIPFNGRMIEDSSIRKHTIFTILNSGKTVDLTTVPFYSVKMVDYSLNKNRFKISANEEYRVTNKNRTIVLYTNEVNLKKARVKKYISETFPTENSVEFILITDFSEGFATMWKHQAYLGIPIDSFIHIESLPKPEVIRVKGSTRTSVVNGVYVASYSQFEEDRGYPDFKLNSLTAESTNTYYYVPMYHSNVCIGSDPTTSQLDERQLFALLRKAVLLGIVPTNSLIYGINKTAGAVLKVGTWINIVDVLRQKLAGAETERLENEMEMENYRAACRDAASKIVHVITFEPCFLSWIRNAETVKLLKYLHTTTNKSTVLSAIDSAIVSIFGIHAKMHKTPEYTIDTIHTIFNEKYMGLFGLVETYRTNYERLATLINFIDENQKTS